MAQMRMFAMLRQVDDVEQSSFDVFPVCVEIDRLDVDVMCFEFTLQVEVCFYCRI